MRKLLQTSRPARKLFSLVLHAIVGSLLLQHHGVSAAAPQTGPTAGYNSLLGPAVVKLGPFNVTTTATPLQQALARAITQFASTEPGVFLDNIVPLIQNATETSVRSNFAIAPQLKIFVAVTGVSFSASVESALSWLRNPTVFPFGPTITYQNINIRLKLNQYLTYSAERQDILEGPAPPPPPFFNVNLAALGKKRALLSEEDQQQQQDAEATEVEAQLAAAAAAEAKRRKELVELIARERDAVLRTGKTPEPFEPGSPEAIFEQHILKMILEGQNCGNGPELIKGSAAHQEITAQQNMARRHAQRRRMAVNGTKSTTHSSFDFAEEIRNFIIDPFPAIANFLSDPILGLCDAGGRADAASGGLLVVNSNTTSSATTTNQSASNSTSYTAGPGGVLSAAIGGLFTGGISAFNSLTRSTICFFLNFFQMLIPGPFRGAVESFCAAGGARGGASDIPFVPALPVLPSLPPDFLNSPAGEAFCEHLGSGVTAWKQWLSIKYTYVFRAFVTQFYGQRLGVEYRKSYPNDQPTLTTTYYTRFGTETEIGISDQLTITPPKVPIPTAIRQTNVAVGPGLTVSIPSNEVVALLQGWGNLFGNTISQLSTAYANLVNGISYTAQASFTVNPQFQLVLGQYRINFPTNFKGLAGWITNPTDIAVASQFSVEPSFLVQFDLAFRLQAALPNINPANIGGGVGRRSLRDVNTTTTAPPKRRRRGLKQAAGPSMPSPDMSPQAADVMAFFRDAMDPILRASADPITGLPSASTSEVNQLLIQLQTLPFALVAFEEFAGLTVPSITKSYNPLTNTTSIATAAFTQITFRTTLQVGVGASAAVVRVPPPKKAAAPAPKATTTSPSGTGSTTGTGGGTGTGSTTGGGVSGGGTTAAGATAQSGPPSAVSPPPGISGGAPTEEFDPFWG